ncbi:unnamed protein product [Brassica oleracea var. botrytis]
MVLVTVCSCPQIIADSRLEEELLDDALPIEDIVDCVCARTVKINVVTVQNLELIGQAAVRSILCEASDIPPFPDEVDDMHVAHMVALIREGFLFEINTWRRGVKASDAKQWKGGNGPDRLGDSEGEHGQASTTDGHGLGGGHGLPLDVPNLVRCLANELQARAGPLLGIIKTHMTQEMVALKEEVLVPLRMPATGGTADLGKAKAAGISTSVSGNSEHGAEESDPNPRSAWRPNFQGASTGGECTEVHGATIASSAAGTSLFAKITASPGGKDGAGSPPSRNEGNNGVSHMESDEQNTARPAEPEEIGEATSGADCVHPESQKFSLIVRLPDKWFIFQAASNENVEKGHVDSSAIFSPCEGLEPLNMDVKLPRHSSSPPAETFEADPKPVGEAAVGPLEEQDRTVSEVPLESIQVVSSSDQGETAEEAVGTEVVEKRASKRLRTQTVLFSPPQPVAKKGKGRGGGKKKNLQQRKRHLRTSTPSCCLQLFSNLTHKTYNTISVSYNHSTTNIINPQPTCRDYSLEESVIVGNAIFKSFFESSQEQPIKAADMMVTFIRRWIHQAGIQCFEFLPASFVEALRGEYQQFSRVQDVAKFSFSSIFGDPCFPNMRWSEQLQVMYFPCQVDRRHWIDEKLEALLNPVVLLMPLLIRHNGGKALNECAMEEPMQITRLDLPICCEPTGLSCVATHILLELHATDNMSHVAHLNEDRLALAAQTYAVEAFACFNPQHLQEFPRE